MAQPQKRNKDKVALIVVDVQPKFIGNGDSQTPDGEKIIPVINELLSVVPNHIVACHCWSKQSAADNPHLGLKLDQRAVFVHKHQADAFDGHIYDHRRSEADDHKPEFKLLPYLKTKGITEVIVCGIFTEWCVKATAISAVKHGLTTQVMEPACAGKTEKGIKDAIKEMHDAGVFIWTNEVFKGLSDCMKDWDELALAK